LDHVRRAVGGQGARAVFEVRSRDVPFIIEDGQIVGRLVYEAMAARPEALYGADLKSNCQARPRSSRSTSRAERALRSPSRNRQRFPDDTRARTRYERGPAARCFASVKGMRA
jgi:hypothetical protein